MAMITGKMAIETKFLEFRTEGKEIDLVDLTPDLRDFVRSTAIRQGRLTVFVPGSTGSILATEYEPRLIEDTQRVIRNLVPRGDNYQHDRIDNNAHSHLRTTLIGSEMTIPVVEGRLTLGTWQQVCFSDFDVHPRHRRVVLQLLGIAPDQ